MPPSVHIRPFISSTTRHEMVSPRPVPPNLRVVDVSTCEYGREDQLARILGNPDPGVAHCEPQCTRRFVVGVALDPDDHFTLLGELDRVPDEVDEDLPQPRRIADQAPWARREQSEARSRALSHGRGWP